ncbi:MAG TPA: glutamate-cysteine ligase family protein, partial [Gemmatimonadaceae bacterium]|nr:glutamate-cysteine ligase family protein [Gemmatimonadaceae bacterium]
MTRPIPAALLAQLREEAFALGRPAAAPPRVGAEVEFIPMVEGGRIAAVDDTAQPSTLPVLRAMGRRLGWSEVASAKAGTPEFRTASGGRITFEPGGQIEYSAPPDESVSALVADLRRVASRLEAALRDAGIRLAYVGTDPFNPIEDVPLRLTAPRYRRMDAHFATIGPHGARMMRQTASIQICLDAGPRPLERWRLLNALTPYLVAIFANSPVYAGCPTGHRSVRRYIWGALDPARTGVVWDREAPVEAYARFAMDAAAILEGEAAPPFRPF